MDVEDRNLLKKSLMLSEENNEILRQMQRSMRMGHLLTFFYWVLIIGSAVGAFYYFQPYLNQVLAQYGTATTILDKLKTGQQ